MRRYAASAAWAPGSPLYLRRSCLRRRVPAVRLQPFSLRRAPGGGGTKNDAHSNEMAPQLDFPGRAVVIKESCAVLMPQV
jgi:hypothetical protein